MKLFEIKKQLKERITLGLNIGLKAIDEALNDESIHRNEFMTYMCQFSDLNRTASMNVLDYTQLEIGFNKIRVGLFSLIENLSEKDLNIEDELSYLRIMNSSIEKIISSSLLKFILII